MAIHRIKTAEAKRFFSTILNKIRRQKERYKTQHGKKNKIAELDKVLKRAPRLDIKDRERFAHDIEQIRKKIAR